MPRPQLLASALAVWLLFLVIAVIFGTIRVALLEPITGKQTAHVIGTLLVTAIFLAIIFFYFRRVRASTIQLALVGILWLVLTVSFEFLFSHFVAGHPWAVLLADYNILQGRIWVRLSHEQQGPPDLAPGERQFC